MKMFVNLNTEQKVDFSPIEQKLDMTLPKELKLIYAAIRDQEEYFMGAEHFLPEFDVYGIAVMYSDEKLLAWIRSNGFYADIHAGAMEETHLEEFSDHMGQVVWK
ncbi:MAG: hypothetical protein NC091_00445 [Bacteroides sp.]|nr:hypothetical protein [Bacteroides sp.]